MKIVIDKYIPFINGVLEPYAEIVYLEGRQISKNDLMNADGLIIRTRTKCNAALLEGTPVRFIASATIGVDHIDADYCRSMGITVASAEGCNSSSVMQYVASALVHLSKKYGFSLSDKIIGIVGVGNVGTKVAGLCGHLGMTVLLNDPPRERREGSSSFVPLKTIMDNADIITLHVPLNRDNPGKTYHCIDEQFFSNLKHHQILINTSRGEVVKTTALKQALVQKKLSGCVIDVWENEPDIDTDLLRMVDLGTPHVAGYSADGKANGTSMSVRAAGKFFGFGLDGWSPDKIPVPDDSAIQIDCRNKSTQEILCHCIQSSYDILGDDQRLRSSPKTFEQQRGEYPLRREFGSYTVEPIHGTKEITSIIKNLGFNIRH